MMGPEGEPMMGPDGMPMMGPEGEPMMGHYEAKENLSTECY
jgi:hypothetical protein